MGPARADHVVAPPPVDPEGRVFGAGQIQHVSAGISGERHPVPPSGPPLEYRLDVTQAVGKVHHGCEEHVEVGLPAGDPPPRVPQAERALYALGEPSPDGHAGGEERDRSVDTEGPVTRVALYLENGRHPPAVLGGKAPGP